MQVIPQELIEKIRKIMDCLEKENVHIGHARLYAKHRQWPHSFLEIYYGVREHPTQFSKVKDDLQIMSEFLRKNPIIREGWAFPFIWIIGSDCVSFETDAAISIVLKVYTNILTPLKS